MANNKIINDFINNPKFIDFIVDYIRKEFTIIETEKNQLVYHLKNLMPTAINKIKKCSFVLNTGSCTSTVIENGYCKNHSKLSENIFPQNTAQDLKRCLFILKTGKNKGNCCSFKAVENGYCKRHFKIVEPIETPYTDDEQFNIDHDNSIFQTCSFRLKTDKNKGSCCKLKAVSGGKWKKHADAPTEEVSIEKSTCSFEGW